MGESSPLAHSPTLSATVPGEDEQRLGAGVQVGDYIVERFIGGGAMGEVYAGRHPVIGKRVAIKVLRHDLAASAEAAERFVREARAANQIEHDNVVDVFGFGRLDDGRMYLVMDLVEGRSLRAHLVDGPLEVSRALAILDQVADALDAAHARGVVHRDLKPDNIMLSSASPKVFVLDFGIAKLISTANAGDQTGPGTLTGQGTWLGTPGYMAPEQWSVDGAGPASDRYALGVIAFELLSGSLPFAASSVPAMMEQHFRARVPALSSRGAVGVPAAVDTVLERALAKDPDARFASARAFVDALRVAAGGAAQRPRGAGAAPGRDLTSGRDLPPGRTLWLPALAGGGVLAIAVVVVILSRDRAASPPHVQPPVDERAPAAAAVHVTTTPSGAEVMLAGALRGVTPMRLEAGAGKVVELVLRKPGYLTETRTVTVEPGAALAVALQEVGQFVGTWRLASGELREFRRAGDRVEVFKRAAVHGGDATFFKHYDFVRAERGVAFGADDEIVDPRAPNDPRCHVRVHVEYRYDPTTDVLEQLRDKVTIGFQDGGCVVQSREVEPTRLTRVDRGGEEVEISAPVGNPQRKPVPTKRKPAPPVKNVTKQRTDAYTPQQSVAPPPNAEDASQLPRQKK